MFANQLCRCVPQSIRFQIRTSFHIKCNATLFLVSHPSLGPLGGIRLRANALHLSTVQALNMLSFCWSVVEHGVQMTSTITQHVEQSEDFTKAHAESWLRILGYAGHCACVGSTCWVQTHSTLLSHTWMTAKQRKCWAVLSEKFDQFQIWLIKTQHSTPLNTSQQGVQMLSTCWAQHVESFVQWTDPVHLHAA